MVKLFILFINMVCLLFIGILRNENVTLALAVPDEVVAGTEFDVEVTLQKGQLSGFARFQQDLPRGLTAEMISSPNANFSFENQSVRFIWLNLPQEEEEISLSYRVKVNERIKGDFELEGIFSYIENNQRKSTSHGARSVLINPSDRIDPNLIVDIEEFQHVIPVQPSVSLLAMDVRCVRQSPYPMGEGNDLQVNLLIGKGATEKFAKIEEVIPQGYTAEAIETRDAIFSYKDRVAKMLWMNLPPDPRFVVSYRLIPQDGVGETDIDVDGTFSFIINGATQVIDIVERDVDLRAPTPQEINGLLASIPPPATTSPVATDAIISTSYTATDGGREIPVEFSEIQDRPRYTQQPQQLDVQYQLEPEEGVYYRVQLAAGHRLVDIRRYFRQYNITEDVRTERHEGWIKYSIGSFYNYKDARDHRVMIWNTTPIDDAFVAAYNHGERITVQEALMITNQMWYR